MNIRKSILARVTFLVLLTGGNRMTAQQLDSYQDPPGISWKRICTPHFEVIFPDAIAPDAQRAAHALEQVYRPDSRSLDAAPPPLTVRLIPHTTVANAYVGLMPRRSEWFTTPPATGLLGSNDWFNLLAAHEFRHVAQFDVLRSGFTGAMSWLFGESAWSFLSSWSVPGWVWEGDAVGMETALTRSGRGRMPEFERDIRTILLSGKRPSYYTAYLHSYKDWYPSIYELGGLLTTHIKRTYGPAAFRTILRRSADWSFFPWSFSMMANSEIDKTAVELYDETMDELTALYRKQAEGLHLTDAVRLNHEERSGAWTNYLNVQEADDGTIIAQKWGMADIYSVVAIDPNGQERTLCSTAAFGEPISVRGGRVAWSERVPDIRWGKRDERVIRILDLRTRDQWTIRGGGKIFSPALSPDGLRVAAVEFTETRSCSIVILDAHTGAEVSRLRNSENDFLQTPSWSNDGTRIAAVRVTHNLGKTICIYDVNTGMRSDALPLSDENVSSPALFGSLLFYTSPASGIDNIHLLDLTTGARWQLTSRPFGAVCASVSRDGSRLLFSDYTPDGFDACTLTLDGTQRISADSIKDGSIRYFEPLVAQEGRPDLFARMPQTDYPIEDFCAFEDLFNFHSWSFLPGSTDHSARIALSSLNIRNTLGLDLGYEHDFNQRTGMFEAGLSYAALFPIIDASTAYGWRSETISRMDGTTQTYRWRECASSLGVRIPLDLSRGVYGSSLTFSATASRVHVLGKALHEPWDNNEGIFIPLTYRVQYIRATQWIRDIYPSSGQFLALAYRHTPFRSGTYDGSLLSLQVTFFAPGAIKSHSVWLQAAAEQQHPVNYHFPSEIRFPRGYDATFHSTLVRGSLNYTMPLLYPDVAAWSLLFVKRVHGTLFGDAAAGIDGKRTIRYYSTGAELLMDFNILTLPLEFSAGIRTTYRIREGQWIAEPIIGIQL